MAAAANVVSYGSWSLKDLKNELRTRGAKLSGRKAELIERLESYDRNFNFKICDTSEPPSKLADMKDNSQSRMYKSDYTQYKDITSESKIPLVSSDKVLHFVNQYSKKCIDLKARNLYTDKFINFLRVQPTANSYCFILANVKAEMKKHVTYTAEVLLSNNGEILETECDCAVGIWPNAHCKHVQAVLLGLQDFTDGRPIIRQITCTEKIQNFHRPNIPFTGSPIKTCNIPIKQKIENIDFDPRPLPFRNDPSYKNRVFNLAINFKHNRTNFPFMQLIPPANPHALEHDHDYLDNSLGDSIIKNLTEVNDTTRKLIEMETTEHSESVLWHKERESRLTASNYGAICKMTDRCNAENFAARLVNPGKLNTKPILHGRLYEKEAIDKYVKLTGHKVNKAGFVIHPAMPQFGCSPDGLIGDNKVIEVKCPYTAKNKTIHPDTVPFLIQENNNLCLKPNHIYYYQVMGVLFITNRSSCDFVVYTIEDLIIIEIQRDEKFITDMLLKLQTFYSKYMKPAILNKHLYRDYKKMKFDY